MLGAIHISCLLVTALLVSYRPTIEDAILVLSVTDTSGEQVNDITITCTGDCAQTSAVQGKVRLKLPPQTRAGEWVTLQIIKRSSGTDWVLISPWDSRVIVPPFENKADNAVPIVVARRGDKQILSSGKALTAITTRIIKGITPKLDQQISYEQRLLVLKQQAEAVGLTPKEVDQAIRQWGRKVKDPSQKDLADTYEREVWHPSMAPRWSVRVANDEAATNIDTKPIPVTIEQMIEFERPSELPLTTPSRTRKRYSPVETSVYVLEARLIGYRFIGVYLSGDLRLVLQGASGETMCAAIPKDDPNFVPPSSRFAKRIAAARSAFRKHFNIPASEKVPSRNFIEENVRVRVTGIGYFGYKHGVRGEAPNAIELHPILDIEFIGQQ